MPVTAVFAELERALAGIARTGVIHVGAHKGQEVPSYRHAGFGRIVLVEPNPDHRAALNRLDVDVVYGCAAGPAGEARLQVPRYDTEASLLRPLHRTVVRTVGVHVRPLAEMQDGCNVAVLDIQGAELDALRTADLTALDAVIVECSTTARYQGAATRGEVHEFFADWTHVGAWPHRGPDLTDEVWHRPTRTEAH